MAYKRTYKKKNFGRRSRAGYGRRKMAGRKSYGRTLKSRSIVTNIVDTVVRRTSELKSHNFTDLWTFPVAGAWNSEILTLVPQGSTSITRVGDRLQAKSMTINLSVYEPNPTPSGGTSGFVRVVFYLWRPLLAAPISASQILGGVVEYDSTYNMENRQMYKILYDVCVPLVAQTDKARNYYSTTLYFTGKDANIMFQAGTTNGTNHIGVIGFASNAGAACTALVRLDTLMRYTDN